MEFDKTIQMMQSMGFDVVSQGKKILKKKKKFTKRKGLYKGFDYNVNKSNTGVELEFVFGKAKKYWQFVDEGVKGKGGYTPGKGAKKGKQGGTGMSRGKGSPFKFKKNNLKKGVIAKWIRSKPLKLRGADGKFLSKTKSNIEGAAFAIGRAIVKRGLERTQFFSRPYDKVVDMDKLFSAFSEDLEISLGNDLENIDIQITV
jgi:hypothetical protein